MPKLSPTARVVLKLIGVLAAAYAGTLPAVYMALVVSVGAVCQLLTVQGTTTDDLIKAAQKCVGTGLTAAATALSASHPDISHVLIALGPVLVALTVPAKGTEAALQSAIARASTPPAPPPAPPKLVS